MAFPSWVEKYREKGTSIRKKTNGRYYKYRVHSERRKDKKYPVLVQDEFLGAITEEGFIPAKKKLLNPSEVKVVSLYEFSGCGIFIEEYDTYEIKLLKTTYLLEIDDKYYFSKLNEEQKEMLNKHKVNYHDGIFNRNIL